MTAEKHAQAGKTREKDGGRLPWLATHVQPAKLTSAARSPEPVDAAEAAVGWDGLEAVFDAAIFSAAAALLMRSSSSAMLPLYRSHLRRVSSVTKEQHETCAAVAEASGEELAAAMAPPAADARAHGASG